METLLATFLGYLKIFHSYIIQVLAIGILGLIIFLYLLNKGYTKSTEKNGIMILYGVFLSFSIAVVVTMTLCGRIPGEKFAFRFQLFGSYMEAFRDDNVELLLQIIMNVIMFVPIGLFLPCCFKAFERNRNIFLSALTVSAGIELIQGIARIGMFESDDIFGNVLGAEIGWFIYWLCKSVIVAWRKKQFLINKIIGKLTLARIVAYTVLISIFRYNYCIWANDLPVEGEIRLDFFVLIWGTTITVLVFIVEIGGNHNFGMSLKRIISHSLGPAFVFISVAALIILYPMAYFMCEKELEKAFQSVTISTFILFSCALTYIGYMSLGKNIRKFVVNESKRVLKYPEILGEMQGGSVKRAGHLIDYLLLTEMIEHIKLQNHKECDRMKEAICGVCGDEKLYRYIQSSTIEHTIFRACIEKMLNRIDISSDKGSDDANLLLLSTWDSLWKKIENWEKPKEKRGQYQLSISIQLLLPFVDYNNTESAECLIKIWNSMRKNTDKAIGKKVLIYLLLYIHFIHSMGKGYDYLGLWIMDNNVKESLKDLLNGNFEFDAQLAQNSWVDWTEYYIVDPQLKLEWVKNFKNDMLKLQQQRGKNCMLRTKVLNETRRRVI